MFSSKWDVSVKSLTSLIREPNDKKVYVPKATKETKETSPSKHSWTEAQMTAFQGSSPDVALEVKREADMCLIFNMDAISN